VFSPGNSDLLWKDLVNQAKRPYPALFPPCVYPPPPPPRRKTFLFGALHPPCILSVPDGNPTTTGRSAPFHPHPTTPHVGISPPHYDGAQKEAPTCQNSRQWF